MVAKIEQRDVAIDVKQPAPDPIDQFAELDARNFAHRRRSALPPSTTTPITATRSRLCGSGVSKLRDDADNIRVGMQRSRCSWVSKGHAGSPSAGVTRVARTGRSMQRRAAN
jgi:hypothetical protein